MNEAKPTLLIVDDELINIDILLNALGKDYAVHVATDGAGALKSVEEALPDLLLLDVMMPDMDGFEVCRRLKSDPSSQDIPIIFLTGLSETKDKVKGFSVGGVDYLTKPFAIEEIRVRVQTQIEMRRQKRELQQSYDKLRELEMLRDSMVHMIVHDMRSPLLVIIGYLELAAMEPLPKGVADRIDGALNGAGTLLTMVSTLLDISKMEAGQMALDVSTVDMKHLVGETIQMVEPLKNQRVFTITSPEDVEAIECDVNLIRRVLQNLISNALKFTNKETGRIAIGIELKANHRMRVSIADNGLGIPKEYHEKVFEKFGQVSAHTQGQSFSTGLGLTFCKLVIEAHGGHIGLESTEGQGSIFWFELPRK